MKTLDKMNIGDEFTVRFRVCRKTGLNGGAWVNPISRGEELMTEVEQLFVSDYDKALFNYKAALIDTNNLNAGDKLNYGNVTGEIVFIDHMAVLVRWGDAKHYSTYTRNAFDSNFKFGDFTLP